MGGARSPKNIFLGSFGPKFGLKVRAVQAPQATFRGSAIEYIYYCVDQSKEAVLKFKTLALLIMFFYTQKLHV